MKAFLSVLTVFLTFSLVSAQTTINVGHKYQIESGALNEKREIWIGLPTFYDSTRSYPTIYVMDAEWQFDITLALSKELAGNDKIPEHIVIGIPKIDGAHRFKDLTFSSTKVSSNGKIDIAISNYFNSSNTGGGAAFYKHLIHEVMPFVEIKHKTNGFDVFIGHSLSGYFGAYILPMQGPFEAFQLYDASIWYNNGDAVKHCINAAPEDFNSNVYITTAAGGKDKQQFHMDMHDSLKTALNRLGINAILKIYENENHGSVRLPSIIDGLTHLYQGFSFGYILATDSVTVAEANKHYAAFSKKVSYSFTCPPEIYRWIGFANHSQANWTEAIKAYQLCLNMFQNDLNVTKEIAESYFALNQIEQSLNFYEKAFSLDPLNTELQTKIEVVKSLIPKN